jgi:hypothetical protein
MGDHREKQPRDLLSESGNGAMPRRMFLRRGFRAVLSFSAITGLLASTSERDVAARSSCHELIEIDWSCSQACRSAYDQCIRHRGSGCATQRATCEGKCTYRMCHAQEGVLV